MDGHRWEARINDFPDEYMYSLSIDGALVGDFNEWPEAWDRGSAKLEMPATAAAVAAVDATRLLARYQTGECQGVWHSGSRARPMFQV